MVPLGFEAGESQFSLERKSRSAPPILITSTEDGCRSVNKQKLARVWKSLHESLFRHAPHITNTINQFNIGVPLSSTFLSLCIIESIFRSVSNLLFISNPLSGLIILTTMFFSAPSAAVLGLTSLIFGIITSLWIVHLPLELTRGGFATFNCFLLGSIIGPLVGVKGFDEIRTLIPICIAVGVFVIFCWAGLEGLLSRVNLPVLNAPCNILSLIFLYSGLAASLRSGHARRCETTLVGDSNFVNVTTPEVFGNFNEKAGIMANYNGTLELEEKIHARYHALVGTSPTHEPIDWYRVIAGVILAQGQIFQTDSIPTSAIVYLSILLYSPILFFQELLGATIGSLIGVCLSQEPYSELYNGGWGYNSLLTSGAIGGFLIAFNLQAWILSVLASILSALLYSALIKTGIPALGLPFMISSWLFLSTTSSIANLDCEDKEDHWYRLYRVTDFTTPEINSRCCTNIVASDDKYRHSKNSVLPL